MEKGIKSVKEMTKKEQMELCEALGYDIDGDVHNGEGFCVIPPNITKEEKIRIFNEIFDK